MYVYVWAYVTCVWVSVMGRAEEDVQSPGAGGTGGCELPQMDAGSELWSSAGRGRMINLSHFHPVTGNFVLNEIN